MTKGPRVANIDRRCRGRYDARMDRDASLEPYRARRARLADVLRRHGGGVAIVPTAPERQRNGDNDHPYRHGSDFHYLTGFAEPGAWLIVAAAKEMLAVAMDAGVNFFDNAEVYA